MMESWFAFLLPMLVVLCAGHGILLTPVDRTTQSANGNKLTPFADYLTVSEASCGGTTNGDAGAAAVVATFNAGETIDVEYDITISHPLAPGVRIALRDPSDATALFTDHILFDFADNDGTEAESGNHIIQVSLPADMDCDSCELQWLWASETDGGFYLGCSDIAIQSALTTGGNSDTISGAGSTTDGNTVMDYFGLDLEPGQANSIAAAVLLPLTFIAICGGAYIFRSKIPSLFALAPCVECRNPSATPSTSLRASGAQHLVTLILLLVIIPSGQWATDDVDTDGTTTFGLFSYCLDQDCEPMKSIDADSALAQGAIEGAQAFAIFAVLATVACLGLCIGIDQQQREWRRSLSTLSILASSCIFLTICLYSAYFYDILGQYPNITLGWAIDLLGVWWVFTLLGACYDYNIHISSKA